MTTVTEGEGSELAHAPGRPHVIGAPDAAAPADGDEVVRLGDEHVSGVESLCVGESQ